MTFLLVLGSLHLFFFMYFLTTDSYPWWMILINSFSLLALFSWSFKPLCQHLSAKTILPYAVFFVVALSLRLYRLDQVTPGMWNDEIASSVAAMDLMQQPRFVPFVPINFGHPTPLLYAAGMVMTLMGKSILSIRLVSVILGALSAPFLFYLAKKLTSFWPALAAALIYTVAYNHIVVSRLAYEMTAAICCHLLAGIFLYRYTQRKQLSNLVGLGVSVGLGIYTYLGFRPLAVAYLLLTGIYIIRHAPKKHFWYLAISLIISSTPILAYSLRHPEQLMERVKSISVFNFGLPASEIAKELAGATYRTLVVTFTQGDPNPRHNPSRTAAYDYVSTALLVAGLLLLTHQKNKTILYAYVLFFAVSMANDIPTLERIPEFHYYGLGHPNMQRLSLLTPLIYLVIAHTFASLYRNTAKYPHLPLLIPALFAAYLNYRWYFHQPMDLYNYKYNNVKELKVALLLQQLPVTTVYVSPSFYQDARIQFFADKTLVSYTPSDAALPDLPSGAYYFLDPSTDVDLATRIVNRSQSDRSLSVKFIQNPLSRAETVVVRKF